MACVTYHKPDCAGQAVSATKTEFEKEKKKYAPYLNSGALVAHNDLLAFTIEKPLGGFLEWHILTFNQHRILEELREVRGLYPQRPHCPSNSNLELNYKKREFDQEKQKNAPFLNLGALTADNDLLAFNIERPLGGFAEWRIITLNQIKILEELREVVIRIEGFGGAGKTLQTHNPVIVTKRCEPIY